MAVENGEPFSHDGYGNVEIAGGGMGKRGGKSRVFHWCYLGTRPNQSAFVHSEGRAPIDLWIFQDEDVRLRAVRQQTLCGFPILVLPRCARGTGFPAYETGFLTFPFSLVLSCNPFSQNRGPDSDLWGKHTVRWVHFLWHGSRTYVPAGPRLRITHRAVFGGSRQ